MTATNITTNDLTDPVLETRRKVSDYNDALGRTLDRVMGRDVDVVEEGTRKLVQILGGTVVSYEDIPEWAHDPALIEPVNDNQPQQLDLFYDYDNTGDET